MPALATGQFEFVHNVHVDGMVHGRVVRPPEVGAALVSVDEQSVAGLPGFIKVVRQKNFLGVVCEKPWQAIQAARALKAAWTPGTASHPRRPSTTICAGNPRAMRWWWIQAMWTRRSVAQRA